MGSTIVATDVRRRNLTVPRLDDGMPGPHVGKGPHSGLEDRGSGVPGEFVPQLFERFKRGPDGSRTGAGLGLAIAQAHAVAHGGSITYEDASPCGARFRLTLPRSQS